MNKKTNIEESGNNKSHKPRIHIDASPKRPKGYKKFNLMDLYYSPESKKREDAVRSELSEKIAKYVIIIVVVVFAVFFLYS
jgi:hypothetical protein